MNTIYVGDARKRLKKLESESVNCIVTSPPYYGLRDYGMDDQIGLEQTPEEYVQEMVLLFREARRVLKDDGTLWLNIGDSYAGSGKGANADGTPHISSVNGKQGTNKGSIEGIKKPQKASEISLKEKDLIGIPWMLAFALRADGWYLRQDIIWSKPNPMPESVKDRCTKSHEYIFLLSKSKKYYYDANAIKYPATYFGLEGMDASGFKDAKNYNGKHKERGHTKPHQGFNAKWDNLTKEQQGAAMANKRSVWSVAVSQFREAHFATFPPELIQPCILAGCPEGGVVLDTFGGAGTTAVVCLRTGRKFIIIELNPKYAKISHHRLLKEFSFFYEIKIINDDNM